MEEMAVNSLIMNAPQKPRRSSEHLLALRRQSLGELDFEFKSESAIATLTKSHIPKNAELEEDQDFPTLFKPNFHQWSKEREEPSLRFDLEASWEEEDAGKEEAKQELSRNLLLNAPKKGKHSAVARFALRKQLQEEALLEEDNFYRKRKFTSFLGEEGVEGEENEGEVPEEDFCRKRKFTLEEEEEEAKEESLELKTLPLKKRVRFNLSSLFRKNLEDFVNEKRMEELENGMKQL